ncbi:hypothetical protein ACHAPI_006537 [Fusarium lateritium]
MSDQYNYPPPPSRGPLLPQPDEVLPSIEVAHLASSESQAPSQPDTQPQQPQARAKAKGRGKARAPRAKPQAKKQQGKLPEQTPNKTAQKAPKKKTPKPRNTQPKAPASRKRSLDEAGVASSIGSAEKKVARENNHPSHPSNTQQVATQHAAPRTIAPAPAPAGEVSVPVNSYRGNGPAAYEDYFRDIVGFTKQKLGSSSSRRSSGQQAAVPSEAQDQAPIDLTQDDSMSEQIDPQLQEHSPIPVESFHPGSDTRMVGGVSLSTAHLGLNSRLGPSEIRRRFFMMDRALRDQQSHVPTLPPSTLAQQPPKEFVGAFYRTIPEAKDPRLDAFVENMNRPLLEKSKTIDLERNNIAAKGTRNRRDEALKKYRRLVNDQQVELNWWRLKAASLGANPYAWDDVPKEVKKVMADNMDNRVQKEEEKLAASEKKQKSQLHSARNTENAQRLREDSKRKERIVQQYLEAVQKGDLQLIDLLEQEYVQEKAARDATASSSGNANTSGASVTAGNTPVTADENTMDTNAGDFHDAEGEPESFGTAGNAFNANLPTGFGNTPAFNNMANYGNGIGFGNGYQKIPSWDDPDAIESFGLSTSNQLMLNQPQANNPFQANPIPDYGFSNSLFDNNQVQNKQTDNTASLSEKVQDDDFQINPFINNNFVSDFTNNNLGNKFETSNLSIDFDTNNLANNNLSNSISQPEQNQVGNLEHDNSGFQKTPEVQYPVYESPTSDALAHNTQASQAFSPSAVVSGNDNQNMSFAGFNAVPNDLPSNSPNMNVAQPNTFGLTTNSSGTDAAQPNNFDFDQASEFPDGDLFPFGDEL